MHGMRGTEAAVILEKDHSATGCAAIVRTIAPSQESLVQAPAISIQMPDAGQVDITAVHLRWSFHPSLYGRLGPPRSATSPEIRRNAA
ncbi:hypothetical protein [Azospirillum endophyticum]